MDKDLLSALDNLSEALLLLAENLDKESTGASPVSDALKFSDIGKELEMISEGIKMIKEDTQKILDNQDTIIKLQKEQKSKDVKIFEESGDSSTKKMITDGVLVIGLIAGAVLAIGLAFSIIGTVDIGSVIALSISIGILSYTFIQISKSGLKPESALSSGLVMLAMAGSITLSSFIFNKIQKITPEQGISAILIAGIFTVLSFGLGSYVKSFKDIDPSVALFAGKTSLLLMPLLFASMALSSIFLSGIKSFTIEQGISAILIGAVFTALSFGLGSYVKSFKDIDPSVALVAGVASLVLFPLLFASMALSSPFLSGIKSFSLEQGISAILIGAVFTALSFGLGSYVKSFQGMDPKVALVAGVASLVLFPLLFASMALSSTFLSEIDTSFSFGQGLSAILIAGIFTVLSFGLGKFISAFKGVTPGTAIIAGILSIIIFPALIKAIAISSPFLSEIDTSFSFGQGLSAIIIAGVFLVLSFMIKPIINNLKDIKVSDFLKASIVIIGLSTLIMISSRILSLGDYQDGSYPSLSWILGVGTTFLVFGLSIVVLGKIASTGAGAVLMAIGAGVVLILAVVIVATSQILSKGKYDKNFPDSEWAIGVATTIGIMGAAAIGVGLLMILTGGVGIFAMGIGIVTILSLAGTIYLLSNTLAKGKYDKNFPDSEWAIGVATTIGIMGAAAIGVGLLMILTGGVGIFAMGIGIVTILSLAGTIYLLSNTLAKGNYIKYPSRDWIDGTITTFEKFLNLSKKLSIFSSFSVLVNISKKILEVDKIFSEGKFEKYPSKEWVDGTYSSILNFSKLSEKIDLTLAQFRGGLSILAFSYLIKEVDEIIRGGTYINFPDQNWTNGVITSIKSFDELSKNVKEPDENWIKGIKKTIKSFSELSKGLKDISGNDFNNSINATINSFSQINKLMSDSSGSGMFGGEEFNKTLQNIDKLSNSFDKLANSFSKFSQSLGNLDSSKLESLRGLTSNVVLMSLMDSEQFESMLNKLEEKSGAFGKLVSDYERERIKVQSSSPGINIQSSRGVDDSVDVKELLVGVKNMVGTLSSILGVLNGLNLTILSQKEKQID